MSHLHLVTIVVREYDPAIDFFVRVLDFELVEDVPSVTNDGRPKRWVVVRPKGGTTGILLARADGKRQSQVVGQQAADRVGFFLRVDDFDAMHARLAAAGVEFVRPPRTEPYGKVAVFVDVAGNRWDLLGPAAAAPDGGAPYSSATRKQVFDLTVADLQQVPVWQFALDEEGVEGQDEATVRPMEDAPPADPGAGMCAVRARFRLADGTVMWGYLTPGAGGDESLPTVQPIIITPTGQVLFWFGAIAPDREVVEECYARLGKTATEVFPVTYESDVPVTTGPVRGTLGGFAHFRSFSDHRIAETR